MSKSFSFLVEILNVSDLFNFSDFKLFWEDDIKEYRDDDDYKEYHDDEEYHEDYKDYQEYQEDYKDYDEDYNQV